MDELKMILCFCYHPLGKDKPQVPGTLEVAGHLNVYFISSSIKLQLASDEYLQGI